MASFEIPHRNLKKEVEVEIVGADDFHHRIDLNSNASLPSSSTTLTISNGCSEVRSKQCSSTTIVLSCTVAACVQFGWALQLSLLTPCIQVFLTLCALVTIYLADEVPLTVNKSSHSSDSISLLDDPQKNGITYSKSKPDVPVVASANGNNAERIEHVIGGNKAIKIASLVFLLLLSMVFPLRSWQS